ncbi:MAG: hypothetical protein A2X87_01570 [Deltaproteobacteria bacterium GWC2_42_51]|nr:MAG: hypothetical protein A2056_02035 [Deltaproteobacteria bacterium GWA2_42_85]OGP35697.1 MAG: hypothetical protein A2X87_01570 [Deltaproteobacteria bacterium GWC2_42_51]OGP43927.1 MAG: hypothetical protein A2090_01865 [Deltaproteobacteria bacterium GWD2_42_10]OGP48371.1 MAG: hypothetical protein A2022_09530 [Deltaproteobacteria bacterium GWF2_42_12]OGQ26895.1 MAG: hypothetical protein A3D29_03320 [Deltaproteobacteria bacterium RIFCSPHIGHO2_02_FULL_42_44]OGQ35941.1 MAG: hypothetical protei
MIFTITLWLHLIAAVIWIGGMLFLVTVLRPVIMSTKKESCGPVQETAELISKIHSRFRTIVGVMIGILIITGLININRYMPAISAGITTPPIIALWIKLFLAIGLFTIYTVNVLSSRKIQASHCIDNPTPQKMKFQMAAVVMAVGILFCSALLRG